MSASSPPQTHHYSPSPDATPDRPGEGRDDTGAGGLAASGSDSSDTSVRPLAVLTDVRKPQIVGGMGYYYLQIRYPEAARQAGIEGRLLLQFVVTADGHPRDIRVARSLHPLCDSAAVEALRAVRFRPAMQAGDPVPVRMTLPVRFRLVDDSTTTRMTDTASP